MSMIEITTGFGRKLCELRSGKGVTQEILAKQMHVTRQTVSGWERGRSEPDIETIMLLAGFFNVTLDELLYMGGVKMIAVNYRKGGIIMLPFVTIGMIIALIANATWTAILSIALFGYVTAIILILLGKRTRTSGQS